MDAGFAAVDDVVDADAADDDAADDDAADDDAADADAADDDDAADADADDGRGTNTYLNWRFCSQGNMSIRHFSFVFLVFTPPNKKKTHHDAT